METIIVLAFVYALVTAGVLIAHTGLYYALIDPARKQEARKNALLAPVWPLYIIWLFIKMAADTDNRK